ncbi:hypothetical protein SAMN05660816_04223 [Niastella yeongjuensis]|nr:hypothetical protein SAMN05660816_04223 [Niastella yeongjuensis]
MTNFLLGLIVLLLFAILVNLTHFELVPSAKAQARKVPAIATNEVLNVKIIAVDDNASIRLKLKTDSYGNQFLPVLVSNRMGVTPIGLKIDQSIPVTMVQP